MSSPMQPRGLSQPVQTPALLYGNIVTADGRSLPDSTSVQLRCGIQAIVAIHPDLNGNFEFDLSNGPQGNLDFGNPSVGRSMQQDFSAADAPASSGLVGSQDRLFDCDVRVSAPGYRPVSKMVLTQPEEVGGINAGTLVLSPLVDQGGTAVSVNSLLVPKKARKEFEKGQRDIRRRHLDSAARHLEKAVADYDKYAAAWNDLGRIELTRNHNDKALHAFRKAIAADPNYVPPYVSVADLQMRQGQYADAAKTAKQALDIRPGLIAANFIEAAADFQLQRFDAAEKNALVVARARGLKIPRVHLLLADIYVRKQKYPSAANELRTYLKEAPHGPFAEKAKSNLEKIERLVPGTAEDSSAAEKQTTSPQH